MVWVVFSLLLVMFVFYSMGEGTDFIEVFYTLLTLPANLWLRF